jgi:hypothetical protein
MQAAVSAAVFRCGVVVTPIRSRRKIARALKPVASAAVRRSSARSTAGSGHTLKRLCFLLQQRIIARRQRGEDALCVESFSCISRPVRGLCVAVGPRKQEKNGKKHDACESAGVCRHF